MMNHEKFIKSVVWSYKNGDDDRFVYPSDIVKHFKEHYKMIVTENDIIQYADDNESNDLVDDIVDCFYEVGFIDGIEYINVEWLGNCFSINVEYIEEGYLSSWIVETLLNLIIEKYKTNKTKQIIHINEIINCLGKMYNTETLSEYVVKNWDEINQHFYDEMEDYVFLLPKLGYDDIYAYSIQNVEIVYDNKQFETSFTIVKLCTVSPPILP